MSSKWSIIVDFDGTITKTDAEVFVASKMVPAAQQKLKSLFDAYEAIEIGLLDYFQGYLELVDIEDDHFQSIVVQTPVRNDLVSLIREFHCQIPVTIVSEGLDVYIAPLLEKHGLGDVPLVCNHVEIAGGRAVIRPAAGAEPCERCLSCKGALVRRIKSERRDKKVVVIGNGASDFCAAKEADVIFARDTLAKLCRDNDLLHFVWKNADDIRLNVPF